MKFLFALFLVCPALAQADGEVNLDTVLTKKLITYFSGLDKSFNGGLHQGVVSYSAEIECSNAAGDSETSTMRCFVRPTLGFSQFAKAPLSPAAAFANELKALLSKNDMSYLINNGFAVLGAKLRCDDIAPADDSKASHHTYNCRISALL